jgi:predicted transcriptional regulator
MTKHEIKAVLDRVLSWPADLQEEAASMLLALEGKDTFYEPTDEERAAIAQGLREAERGEFASDEEVEALLRRPWR